MITKIKSMLVTVGFWLIYAGARPGEVTGIKVVIFLKEKDGKRGQYFERWLLPNKSNRKPENTPITVPVHTPLPGYYGSKK